MANEQKEMEQLTGRMYQNYLRPKIREDFQTGAFLNGASPLGWFLATVTQALTGGKITVQKPFDNTTIALTPVASMQGAQVGDQVVVIVFGCGANAANSIIFAYSDFSNL